MTVDAESAFCRSKTWRPPLWRPKHDSRNFFVLMIIWLLVTLVFVWMQLWNSSRRPGEWLWAGREAPVHHVQAADVRQLASHLVFLLQRIHHTLPWVRLNLFIILKWWIYRYKIITWVTKWRCVANHNSEEQTSRCNKCWTGTNSF